MDDGNKTIDFLGLMDPTKASPSTHSLQFSPKMYRKNDEAEARKPTIGCKRRSRPLNQDMDPKKLKRILSNRASADKARLKQSQHIYGLERKAKALEAHIVMLSPQIGLYQKQHEMLLKERENLKRKLSDCTRDKHHKEAEIEENKFWVRNLRLTLHKQREITPTQAIYKGKMVSFEENNNPAQIGKNTGEVTSKQSEITAKQGKKEEGHTWMPTPRVPKMVPALTLSIGRWSEPQPEANSKSKDPLSLSLGIN